MMKLNESKFDLVKVLDFSVLTGLLVIGSATAAHAGHDGAADRLRFATPEMTRQQRHELRVQRRDLILENRAARSNSAGALPTASTIGLGSKPSGNWSSFRGHAAVLFPGQNETFHTARPNQGNSTYITDRGRTRDITRGVSLDLSSTNANIVVGENLFDGNTTIQVGTETRIISAGSKVTAAEYAALKEKLATGTQSLALSRSGAAEGGSLNLNLVGGDGATIRASELVIPQNVSVTGDFARTADGVRVTRDLVNYGSLLATSSNPNRNTAFISARDFNNENGGTISSLSSASNPNLNLALRADNDFMNSGTITSAGDLEISAGRSINNNAGSVVTANGNVLLNASAISNQGVFSSANSDITFSAAPDVALLANNVGGTLNAANGAINIRSADYSGTANSTLVGGNLYSKEVNLHAGQGTADLIANQVTGVVNTSGLGAHVSTNTENLVLGEQCLTGDPTYYNTGNIILGGNVIVGEDLAIIAGGDITTNQAALIIRAQDAGLKAFNITMIAGANITAGSGEVSPAGGPATLPGQSIGSISQNATAPVTVDGASALGGNIDLQGATTSVLIDASSGAANGKGGNITLAAYGDGVGGNGQVLIGNTAAYQISAGGNGAGANGNVTVIAGKSFGGAAITLGKIDSFSGTGGGGNVLISNTPVATSDLKPITFGTNGSVTSGNTLVGTNPLFGTTTTVGDIKTRGSVTVLAGGVAVLGNIDVSSNTVGVSAGNVSLGATSTISTGNITASNTTTTGNGGKISIIANSVADIDVGGGGASGTGLLTANGGSVSGNAGSVLIKNNSIGGIKVTAIPTTTVASGDGGGLTLDASNGTLDVGIFGGSITRNGVGASGSGGTIVLKASNLLNADLMTLTANGSGTGKGGTIEFYAENAVILGNVNANGGVSGVGGDGGNISVTVTNSLSLNPNSISANGGGTAGDGGSITLVNRGSGGISLDPTDYSYTAFGDGGHLTIDAVNGPLAAFGPLSLSANAGGASFANGSIYLNGVTFAVPGSLNLTATGGIPGTGDITLPSTNAVTTNGGSFFANSGGTFNARTIDTAGPGNSGSINIIAGGKIGSNALLSPSLLTFTNSSNDGASVSVSSASGDINLGNIFTSSNGGGKAGDISVIANAGKINLSGLEAGGSAVDLTLTAASDISLAGEVYAPSANFKINLLGPIPGNYNSAGNDVVNNVTGTGGGTINFTASSNPIVINGLGASQSFVGTTTDSGTGVLINSTINTTGTLTFNTPRFQIVNNVTAASLTVQSAGDLTVVGAAGSPTIKGTTPAAGAPGFPSTPPAIIFQTANGANLNFFSNITFTGDVAFNNFGGKTTTNSGSFLVGNNNIKISTDLFDNQGGISANNLLFSGTTIANTTGALDLSSAPLLFNGRDLAIIALTDITLPSFVDTSTNTGDGGNVTILAGYKFDPPITTPVTGSSAPFTFSATQTSSGSIFGTATIDTKTLGGTGDGGNLTVIANNGSVSLANFNTSSVGGAAGNALIIGSTGVSVGNAVLTGATSGGNLTLSVSDATVINGPSIVVQEGLVSGGSFAPGATRNAGALSVGSVGATNANIVFETKGTMNMLGALDGRSIQFKGDGAADLTFSALNTISVNQTAGGDGGFIGIDANSIFVTGSVPLTLNAIGVGVGKGGTIDVKTKADMILGLAGTLLVNTSGPGSGGKVFLQTAGDLTTTAFGINATGGSGDGATISLRAGTDGTGTLTLTESSYLSAANAQGANGKGGTIVLDSPLMVLNTSAATPLVLSADGKGNGDGGSVTFLNNDLATTVIGTAAKAPKPPANFLTISAKSGSGSGGAGGTITVDVGSNLIINTAGAVAGPQGSDGNGANYSFTADNDNTKGGNLVITGNLDATGNGAGTDGTITLASSSKTAFSIGGTKPPKNGIFGTLSAASTSVTNDLGGITLVATNNLNSAIVDLSAGAKGAIAAGKGAVITASLSLTMAAENGSIGKKALLVSAPVLNLSTSGTGSVNVSDTFNGTVTLGAGNVGGGLTLVSSKGLSVSDYIATNGSINLTAGDGVLSVSGNVKATNGGIIVANSNLATGSVVIGAGANVETAGKGGNVVLAIGAPPKKGSGPNTLAGFNVTPTGKGLAFFGPQPAGVISGGTVNVFATNKNVIFNNLSTGGQTISVGNGATITADPPSRIASHPSSIRSLVTSNARWLR